MTFFNTKSLVALSYITTIYMYIGICYGQDINTQYLHHIQLAAKLPNPLDNRFCDIGIDQTGLAPRLEDASTLIFFLSVIKYSG